MSDEKDILFTANASGAKTPVVKKSRSYGATSKSLTTVAQKTQLHKVRPNDTLISLAIKYETSAEELKRLNSLWSNDALQLKSTIKVPVTSAAQAAVAAAAAASAAGNSSLEQFVNEEENQQPVVEGAAAVAGTAVPGKHHSGRSGVSRSKTFTAGVSGASAAFGGGDRDFSEMDSNEFLRKFDLQFMQIKTNVEKMENESSLSEEDSAAYSCLPPRRSARYMSRQAFRSADQALEAAGGGPSSDSLANPELVVRSRQMPESEETFYKL